MKKTYEILLFSTMNTSTIQYVYSKTIKGALKKLKKIKGLEGFTIHSIRVVADKYARAIIKFNVSTDSWESITHYRQGSVFINHFAANLKLNEEKDYERALKIVTDRAIAHFNINAELLKIVNVPKYVKLD